MSNRSSIVCVGTVQAIFSSMRNLSMLQILRSEWFGGTVPYRTVPPILHALLPKSTAVRRSILRNGVAVQRRLRIANWTIKQTFYSHHLKLDSTCTVTTTKSTKRVRGLVCTVCSFPSSSDRWILTPHVWVGAAQVPLKRATPPSVVE